MNFMLQNQSHSKLISVVFIFSIGCVSHASAQGWTTYKVADDTFTMNFPADPTKSMKQIPDGSGEYAELSCRYNRALFAVTWMPLEKLKPQNSDEILKDGIANLKLMDKSARVFFANTITYNDAFGADYGTTLTATHGTVFYHRQRTLVTKTHILQIVVLANVSSGNLETWDIDLFINSLREVE